jgi:hypothetical protein
MFPTKLPTLRQPCRRSSWRYSRVISLQGCDGPFKAPLRADDGWFDLYGDVLGPHRTLALSVESTPLGHADAPKPVRIQRRSASVSGRGSVFGARVAIGVGGSRLRELCKREHG